MRQTPESCWRQRCRYELLMARCRCRVMLATMLPGQLDRGAMMVPNGDDAVETTWPRRNVAAEVTC
jgi:hypothetical protein